MVELAVCNAGTGTHPLHLAGTDDRTVTHAVLVFQCPFQDIGNDLHVTVGMDWKTFPWLNPILVDDPQLSETHVLLVVIIGKGKGVAGIEPTVVGTSSFC